MKKYKILSIYMGKDSKWNLICDAAAVSAQGHDNRLLVASVAGKTDEITSLLSALSCKESENMRAVFTCAPTHRDHQFRGNGFARRDWSRYHSRKYNIGYDSWHCVIVSGRQGMLMNASDDALWAELTSTDFTTPLCRHWVAYIKSQIVKRKLYRQAHAFGCLPILLNCTNQDLDDIVHEGLKNGALHFDVDQRGF